MGVSKEIYIHPPCDPGGSFSVRLPGIFRQVLKRPGFRGLRRLARRALSVAEPLGRLAYQPCPGFPGECEQGCEGVKVLSANLWHDFPLFRELEGRLESFVALIQAHRPDIILLQEVLRTRSLRVDEWLAERLGMGYLYSRANGHAEGIGFEEGLALFSRFPIHTPQLIRLGVGQSPFVRRAALGAAVDTPCGPLLAFSAHLGLPRRENAAQLAHLRQWVSGLAGEGTAVIGGDFNAFESSPEIMRTQSTWVDTFRSLHPEEEGVTHELRLFGRLLRRARLDYIFLHAGRSRWRILETHHVEGPAGPHSDHKAVVTCLKPV